MDNHKRFREILLNVLNNKGYIVCYCFDNSTNFDNFETIQLTKTNGGLIRIN